MKYTCRQCKNERLDETDKNCWSCGSKNLDLATASLEERSSTKESDIQLLLDKWEKSGLNSQYTVRWEDYHADRIQYRLYGWWVADDTRGFATVRVPAIVELQSAVMGESLLKLKRSEKQHALAKLVQILSRGDD